MLNRRTFLLKVATVGTMSIILGRAHRLIPSPTGDQIMIDDGEFDFDGFYVAVAREFDGSVTLSELINNKLKESKTFLIDDVNGIIGFISATGLARIVFIDWHGTPADSADIRAHEISIDWKEENPLIDLPTSFRECADLLSCPSEPQLG